jgi:predicted extracellular nuclease
MFIAPAPARLAAAPALAPRNDGQLRIGQFNAHNLFDTVDAPSTQDPVSERAAYRVHLAKLAVAIRDSMGAPDIITMQEVENIKVLKDLVARPEIAKLGYKALLQEGTDPRGIDNAILYRPASVTLTATEQLDPQRVSAKGRASHVFTRPPLVATFAINGREDAKRGVRELTVVSTHFTSKLGGEDAAVKRAEQAKIVADYVTGMVALNEQAPVLVAGDFNMEYGEPEFAALRNTRRAASMASLGNLVAAGDRFSWRDGRKHLMLDHVLATKYLAKTVADVQIPRISTYIEQGTATDPVRAEGVSDHDPVVTTFDLD